MDENNVTFSKAFLRCAEGLAMINSITALMPEEEAKKTKMIFRAFAKRGVSPQTLLDALAEVAMEGGFNNG